MGVWIFYLLAMLPLIIGGILFAKSDRINWQEWIINSAVCFLLAAGMHWFAIDSMTKDIETWSGQIVQSVERSAWLEYYEYAVYRTESTTTTDSKGNSTTTYYQVFDHWEPSSRWHNIHWQAYSNIETDYEITHEHHSYLERQFNDRHAVQGVRHTMDHASHMIQGDPYDYAADNHTGWVEPVTKLVKFENRIKAAPSVFSFVKPPPGKVYPYPANDQPFVSDRLLGAANLIDKLKFDQMNARLGPKKKVNVIIVGFSDKGSEYGQMQQAEWIGGKKNDIVITYGGSNKKPTWCTVFGWTEKDVTKRNLESIILENGAVTESLPLIEKEIAANYVLKDWKKFDYIQIQPPAWSYLVFGGVLILGQAGFWYWAWNNDFTKNTRRRMNPRSYYR